MKLSTLALVLGVTFSGSAFAAAVPWGSATPAQYASWDVFESVNDTTPDIGSNTTGSIKVVNSSQVYQPTLIASGNFYSFTAPLSYEATLGGTAGGLFDVYLQIGSAGSTPEVASAKLNGVAASLYTVTGTAGTGMSASQEQYWVWENVAGANLYTFNFSGIQHMSLQTLTLAAVSVSAVPEPEAYGMMALGLGLVSLARRRQTKNQA